MPNLSCSTLTSGAEAVRGAGGVGDDVVLAVVLVVVDAEHDGEVLVLGRRGDDDLLGTGVEVALGLGGVGEDAGGFDDDVDAQVAPRQRGRASLTSSALILVLPMTMVSSPSRLTSSGSRPRIESNFSRCARLALSVRSLTAMISMSVLLPSAFCAARAR